jgi:hypothetical protein
MIGESGLELEDDWPSHRHVGSSNPALLESSPMKIDQESESEAGPSSWEIPGKNGTHLHSQTHMMGIDFRLSPYYELQSAVDHEILRHCIPVGRIIPK